MPLASLDVTPKDGGLGRRGPAAAGVFAAVGPAWLPVGGAEAGAITAITSPAQARARLGVGPLAKLVERSLSLAGTTCYTVPFEPVVGAITGPAEATLKFDGADAAKAKTKATDALRASGLTPCSLAVRVTATNTADGKAAGAKMVPVIDGVAGAEFTLAGSKTSNKFEITGTGIEVTLTLKGASTKLTVGSEWTIAVSVPDDDLTGGADLLRVSRHRFEWIAAACVTDSGMWGTLATKAEEALKVDKRYLHFKCQVRAPLTDETPSGYATEIAKLSGENTSDRVQVYGHWLLAANNAGRFEVTPALDVACGWSARRRPHEPADATEYGAVPGVEGLYPALTDGDLKVLNDARFAVFRSYPGVPGIYIGNARMLSEADSDFVDEDRRRVMDKACRLVREKQFRHLNGTVLIGPDGQIAGARTLRRVSQQPLEQMVQRQEISDGGVEIDLAQDILSEEEIVTEVWVVPLGKQRRIRTTVSFRNPLAAFEADAVPGA